MQEEGQSSIGLFTFKMDILWSLTSIPEGSLSRMLEQLQTNSLQPSNKNDKWCLI